jgi:hypothetical protein
VRIELKYFEGSRLSAICPACPSRAAAFILAARSCRASATAWVSHRIDASRRSVDAEAREQNVGGEVLRRYSDMSRIGKKPITVPAGVTATTNGRTLSVKGPKGTLELQMLDEINYALEDGSISVQPANDSQRARGYWGMQRTMVQEPGYGCDGGLHQDARDHRRWSTARDAGQEPAPAAWL